jgi:hypothetical protein
MQNDKPTTSVGQPSATNANKCPSSCTMEYSSEVRGEYYLRKKIEKQRGEYCLRKKARRDRYLSRLGEDRRWCILKDAGWMGKQEWKSLMIL